MATSRMALRLNRFMRVKPICNLVFKLRFLYYVDILGRFEIHEDAKEVIGHDYSISQLKAGKTSDRILWLIQPLAAIDKMGPDTSVLAIGCRFETDLLYLCAYGFSADKVQGFDMISYSPWIDAGNMHHMEYEDSSWDCILMGWTLAYSDNPKQAAEELIRVTKDGGVIALSVSYYPQAQLDEWAADGKLIGSQKKRIQTVDGMLKLFGKNVDRVYYQHDVADQDSKGYCAVIFSIKKAAPKQAKVKKVATAKAPAKKKAPVKKKAAPKKAAPKKSTAKAKANTPVKKAAAKKSRSKK